MGTAFHGVLIYILGLVILFLELFIPSGGILGVIGTICTLYGIWTIIAWNIWAGIIVIIATSAYIYGIIKFWSKKITMKSDLKDSKGSSNIASPPEMIGCDGIALTKLRPAGYVQIKGKRLQVISDGGYIEKGQNVRVVEVSGNRIIVSKIESELSKSEEDM